MTRYAIALSVLLCAGLVHASTLTTSYQREAQGDYTGARSALPSPDEVDATILGMRSGWLHYLDGDYDNAVRAYQAVIRYQPSIVEARLGLTLPLMAQAKWVDVLTQCDAILTAHPGEPTAGSRRAWALYNLGRFAESEAAYADLLVRYPTDVELRAGLGWAQCRQGDTPRAQATFATVLSLDETHASALEGAEVCR